MSLSFTYEQQEQLLVKLLPVLKPLEDHANTVRARGFSEFDLWGAYEAACCVSDAELKALAVYRNKRAEFFFSRPDGFLGRELAAALDSFKPWGSRYDYDSEPESRKLAAFQRTRSQDRLELRNYEYSNWRLHNPSTPLRGEYNEYFSEAIGRVFGSMGFHFDEKKSLLNFPVYSKRLLAEWDICWSAETRRTLTDWPRAASTIVEKWSPLDLCCYISPSKRKGEIRTPIGFQKLEFVILRLDRLIDGFSWAYSRVNGIDQVDFCVAAYGALYATFAQRLEYCLSLLLSSSLPLIRD